MSKVKSNVGHIAALALDSEEASSLKDAVILKEQAQGKFDKMADLFYSKGKRAHHFEKAAAKDDPDLGKFHDRVNGVIVSAFDTDAQKLYAAEPKTLNMTQVAMRQIIRDKVSDHFNSIRKALVRLEARIASGKTEKSKPSTKEQMVLKAVQNAIKYIGESKKGYDGMVDDLTRLKTLNVLKQVKA